MVSDGWSSAYNCPHHLPSPTHFHFKLTHSPPVSGHVISKLHIIPAHRIIIIMVINISSCSSIITIFIIFVIIIICKTFWSTLKSIDAKCAKTTNECEMYCMVLHGAAYIGAWCNGAQRCIFRDLHSPAALADALEEWLSANQHLLDLGYISLRYEIERGLRAV